MRSRRPTNQGTGGYNNNNQHRRPRFQQGGDRPQGGHSGNRPRRNYSQAREKYIMQARDALASGDRVLAESFFQHADHCYRMMVEEGYNPRQQQNATAQTGEQQAQPAPAEGNGNNTSDDGFSPNASALPAFITAAHEQPKPVDPATVQNWEDRDA
jgi:hypothetical protein